MSGLESCAECVQTCIYDHVLHPPFPEHLAHTPPGATPCSGAPMAPCCHIKSKLWLQTPSQPRRPLLFSATPATTPLPGTSVSCGPSLHTPILLPRDKPCPPISLSARHLQGCDRCHPRRDAEFLASPLSLSPQGGGSGPEEGAPRTGCAHCWPAGGPAPVGLFAVPCQQEHPLPWGLHWQWSGAQAPTALLMGEGARVGSLRRPWSWGGSCPAVWLRPAPAVPSTEQEARVGEGALLPP